MCAHGGKDGLEFVAAFAVHPHLVALNLGGYLEFAVANERGDLLGHRALDSILKLDGLPGVAERGDFRIALFDAFQADAALGELANDHFVERSDLVIVLGGELDFGFFQDNFRLAALEIKAVGELFFGLINSILNFH